MSAERLALVRAYAPPYADYLAICHALDWLAWLRGQLSEVPCSR